MSTNRSVRVTIRNGDNLIDRIQAVYDRITRRAYEQWLSVSNLRPPLSEIWTAAEHELVSKPQTSIREWGHGVLVEIDCSGVDPANIRLFMSSMELLVLAPLETRGTDKWIFQHLQFGAELDGLDANAEVENGILRVSATWSNAPEDSKVRFCVA